MARFVSLSAVPRMVLETRKPARMRSRVASVSLREVHVLVRDARVFELHALGQHGDFVRVLDASVVVAHASLDALDVAFDVRFGLDVEADLRAVDEKLAVVLHRVVVAVDPRREWSAARRCRRTGRSGRDI